MPETTTLIELDAKAMEAIRILMAQYGEARPDDMISRALGLLSVVHEFVHDGYLTVIDPAVPSEHPSDEREVELRFDKVHNATPNKVAA